MKRMFCFGTTGIHTKIAYISKAIRCVCVCVLRAISHDKFNHVLLHLSVGSFCIASGNYRNILEIRAQQQFEHFVAMKN